MADSTDFMLQQQEAIERMKEMSRRSKQNVGHTMPPAPSFVKLGNQNSQNTENTAKNPPQNKSRDKEIHKDTYQKPQNGFNIFAADSLKSLLGFDLPFLDKIKNEPDISLILGLLLILWSEKADKKLLLALLYILF